MAGSQGRQEQIAFGSRPRSGAFKGLPCLRFLRVLLVAVMLCAGRVMAGGDYAPDWREGDQWTVRSTYTVPGRWISKDTALINRDDPYAPNPRLQKLTTNVVDYAYKVKRVTVRAGKKTAVVRVSAPPDRPPHNVHDWLLYFGMDEMVVTETRKVSAQLRGVVTNRTYNALDADSYLSPHFTDDTIIHDFPKIPTSGVDETRVFRRSVLGERPIVQTTSFTQTNVTSSLVVSNRYGNRFDYRVTVIWEPGKKWWQRAWNQIGTNVIRRCELLEGE